jgi:predicted AAA+ superfamily ATPase
LAGRPEEWATLLERLLCGGYPEVLSRDTDERRAAWFGSYVTTLLQRDVRDLSNIEGLTTVPRLLSLLAARATSLLNFSELSRSLAMPQSTLKRYLALLEMTFLLQPLPPWSSNRNKRLVKAPKLMLNDTGLLASLLSLSRDRLLTDRPLTGPMLENFVVLELRKQLTWSRVKPQLFHFRTQTGQEVDVVLEDGAGRIVGIEVKASGALMEVSGERFQRGIVLYTGMEPLPFGPRLHAFPLQALWRLGS